MREIRGNDFLGGLKRTDEVMQPSQDVNLAQLAMTVGILTQTIFIHGKIFDTLLPAKGPKYAELYEQLYREYCMPPAGNPDAVTRDELDQRLKQIQEDNMQAFQDMINILKTLETKLDQHQLPGNQEDNMQTFQGLQAISTPTEDDRSTASQLYTDWGTGKQTPVPNPKRKQDGHGEKQS